MGRKCSVEGCLSDSNRPEDVGVTFHKVPLHPDVRPKWMSLCRIPEDKKLIKIIYVCSRHFLRADFCNFKGKKYMLRQGVLPSVFPWDKSKLEAIKAEASIKKEISTDDVNLSIVKKEELEIKLEPESDTKQEIMECESQIVEGQLKVEPKEKLDEFEKSKLAQTSTNFMNFTINSRIEALDFNNEWYPARIVEVDYEENEVLIHFEKFSSKYDEWICMNSSRLRPLQPLTKKGIPGEQYVVGERCLAAWSDARKFPATVTKIMDHDTYEVLFDDGFVKTLKAHRMSKTQGKTVQSAPLFDPIKSSKQDRRDKKRKINVAALFKKRPRIENTEEKAKKSTATTVEPDSLGASTSEVDTLQNWAPHWHKGKPVGIESTIETNDGQKNSVIVPDPRLPIGWKKHLVRRTHGAAVGKWESIIVSPDSRKFKSKTDVRNYIEQNPKLEISEQMFDFSLTAKRQRKSCSSSAKKAPVMGQQVTPVIEEQVEPLESPVNEEANANSLKILFEDDAFKCPIEGCGKNFRRENLAQMHVKHYHPEYTKFLDSTPNVADLAYARTVGENLDKSPGLPKAPPVKQTVRTSTPKVPKLSQSPLPEVSDLKPPLKPQSPALSKAKDAEIIKLLNAKPFDKKEIESIQPMPSGLPMNMYPDIKLKDLLNSKSEAMPKRDDINLKTLCTTRPPVGIKTLLPVVRAPVVETSSEEPTKTSMKRKRGICENIEIIKGKEIQQTKTPSSSSKPSVPTFSQPPSTPLETQPQQQQPPQHQPPLNNIIIEGGEVIKIVRMRQEEIINCTCGFTEEDGLMIQCELCLCWQHAYCNNIERESQVPDKYICYICQHPLRERTSRKFFHDQDWLKQGTLPTGSYHSKDDEALQKRFEKLKKCHDISGGLLEIRKYMHSLNVKMKIAEAKNHPKLYLWSKPWEKQLLPEKIKQENEDIKPKIENDDHHYIKNEIELEKQEPQNDSMLMMILKAGKEVMPKIDLSSLMDNNMGQLSAPIIPQPEAAIDSADCRLNLLEHIIHQESLVEERLDDFEKQIDTLETGMNIEGDPNYPKTRQTLQMLIRDLGTLKQFSQSTTI